MPLPLGHCLLGLSIAVSFYNKFNLKREWKFILFCAFLSIVPDFDLSFVYFFGLDRNIYHRTFTHSILFIICLSLIVSNLKIFKHTFKKRRLFLIYFMILFSHIGLDYFGSDTHPPSNGIMIFFPFSTDFYASPIPIFPSVDASKEGLLLLLDVLIKLGIEFVVFGGILLGLIKIKSR